MQSPRVRADGRKPDELRPVTVERGFVRHAAGSVLYAAGETRIICTASLAPGVPLWLEGSGQGWATAEYAMLPAATADRRPREGRRGGVSGRSAEIQRILGRSLRSILDLTALAGFTLHVDCDVVDADGSTRTAAITGAYVALRDAVSLALAGGAITRDPVRAQVAAVSVGMVDDAPMIDLTYPEDSRAAFDLNLAASSRGGIIDIQGTAEGPPLDRQQLEVLIDLGLGGLMRLFQLQRDALAGMA